MQPPPDATHRRLFSENVHLPPLIFLGAGAAPLQSIIQKRRYVCCVKVQLRLECVKVECSRWKSAATVAFSVKMQRC
jgi:hypothetical protein